MNTLKEQMKEAAKDRLCKTLDMAWDDIWKAKDQAAKEFEGEDGKFSYKVSAGLTLHPMGSGDGEVSAKASWSIKQQCEPPSKKVSEHPQLPGMEEEDDDSETIEGATSRTEDTGAEPDGNASGGEGDGGSDTGGGDGGSDTGGDEAGDSGEEDTGEEETEEEDEDSETPLDDVEEENEEDGDIPGTGEDDEDPLEIPE